MERKDWKLWARKEANNHRWQIWKCLLIILLVTLGLIVSLILIFNWLLSLKTTSIIGVLDFVIVLESVCGGRFIRLDSKSMLGFVLLVSCGSRKSAASQLPLCECGRVLSQQVRCGLEGVCAKF